MSRPGEDLKEAVARKGSFVGSFKAVLWSFFGVRKRDGFENDISKLNPVHVIVAGLLAAAGFVVSLIWLVQWVVSSGAAK